MFFCNLLLDTNYELKNRFMHVDSVYSQSSIPKVSKSQFNTFGCTLEELAVLELISNNPSIKQGKYKGKLLENLPHSRYKKPLSIGSKPMQLPGADPGGRWTGCAPRSLSRRHLTAVSIICRVSPSCCTRMGGAVR